MDVLHLFYSMEPDIHDHGSVDTGMQGVLFWKKLAATRSTYIYNIGIAWLSIFAYVCSAALIVTLDVQSMIKPSLNFLRFQALKVTTVSFCLNMALEVI